VTAYTAHREWARRPPDERYASVHALAEAARARGIRTDAHITETVGLAGAGRDQRTGGVSSEQASESRHTIIVFTAMNDARIRQRCSEVGVSAFVSKMAGDDDGDLLSSIKRLCGDRG
jgi:AmiR/NasT family two-component response regulator